MGQDEVDGKKRENWEISTQPGHILAARFYTGALWEKQVKTDCRHISKV